MENFLDEVCIQSNGQPVTSEDLELTFDYSFLAPPLNLKNSVKLTDEENQDFIDKQAGRFDYWGCVHLICFDFTAYDYIYGAYKSKLIRFHIKF